MTGSAARALAATAAPVVAAAERHRALALSPEALRHRALARSEDAARHRALVEAEGARLALLLTPAEMNKLRRAAQRAGTAERELAIACREQPEVFEDFADRELAAR